MQQSLLLLFAVGIASIGAAPCNNDGDAPCVSGISPQAGSINGATRVTIHGFGFVGDLYSGTNEVYMVSSTREINCTIHQDGCTEIQIMCYTEPMPADNYYVKVVLDGTPVPTASHCNDADGEGSNCRFQATTSNTPTITSFSVKSQTPGNFLDVEGKMFTSLFGTDEEESTNGRAARFTRVWTNSGKCDLVDSDAVFYDLALDGEEGTEDTGHFTCMPTGTYVGNQNLTYIINEEFGRSKADISLMNVMGNNDLAMFQTYAEVTGLSHSSGSVEGGVPLTITGNNFDNTRGEPMVTVGGVECEDAALSGANIRCTIPEEPGMLAMSGNRGISFSFWNISSSHSDDDESIRNYTIPDSEEILDGFYFYDDLAESYSVAIMRGFFVAPSTNRYKFLLSADDQAVLYLSTNGIANDSVETIRVNSYNLNQDGTSSEDFDLQRGQEVYVEVIVRNLGGDMGARLSAHMYDTVYTASESGQAKNEKHRIVTSSDVVHEVQRITLDSWESSDNIREEKQSYEISVESDPAYCFYRIGLFNSYTVRIAVDAQATTIKQALMNLPYFTSAETLGEPEIVPLTQTSWRFTLSLKFLGNYPMLDIMEYPLVNYDCTMSISEVTGVQDGAPTGHYLVPFFMGVPGTPISKDDISANTIRSSLNTLFSVQCPTAITAPSGSPYKQDFEGTSGSETTSEYAPFCGRAAATPRRWQDFVELYNAGTDEEGEWNSGIGGAFSKVCFGYMGNIRSSFWVRYMYEERAYSIWLENQFNSIYAENNPSYYYNRWNYACLDLFTDFIQVANEAIASAASIEVLQMRVYDDDVTGEYPMLIDTIVFNRDFPTDDPMGVAQFERMQMDGWIADTIGVAAVSDVSNAYDVEIQTLECAYNLPLLSFDFGIESPLNADNVTWSFQDGASVNVARQSAASPPVTGTVRLSSGVNVLSMSAQYTEADQLANYLTSLSADVGSVAVERQGDCRGYRWDVEYTAIAGDHIDLQDAGSSVSGVNAAVTFTKIQDGGVHWHPLFGDVLRSYHETPQVVVAINSIPSLCTSDCSFEWSEADTPTLTSISPTSGGYGDTVTIQGSGFSTNDAENEVLIGRASCTVTSSSTNSITCTVGEGTPGPRAVKVVVTTKGAARNDSLVQFTYDFGADSVSPSSGYSSGGAVVTVSGSGFGDEVEVTIDGNACDIIASDYTEITCVAPAGTSGSQSVVVSENGVDASGSHSFTYTSAPAAITAISTSTANVGGDTEITITGSGFGSSAYSDADPVVVGGEAATVTSYADTEIVATLPVMEKGSYTLNVMTDASGYADRNTDTTINYILRVDNVFPRQGSLMGGQKLTLTGQGFSTSDLNTVSVGEAACVEETATATQIVCQLEYTTNTYTVTNQGSHQTHGSGYAWSPNYLEVEVGDFASFEWTTPDSVTGIGYRVVQVASPGSTVAVSGGFISSSIQTANGVYLYQFTQTGTYYYYSGMVTPGFGMWGTVVVTEKANYVDYVTLMIGDVEADYNPSSGVSDPSDSSVCSPLLSVPAGCDEVTGSDPDRFDVGLWTCMMPTITSIQPATVVANQDITISGSGFSTTLCQNEVSVETDEGGSVECVVSSASATQIVCSIPPSCEGMPTGIPLSLTVRVSNYGYALDTQLAKTDRGIVIGSSVTSVTPTLGSTEGGQLITVTGANLCFNCGEGCGARRRRSNLQDHENLDGGNVDYYDIGVNICNNVVSVSPTEVVCTTQAVPGLTVVTVSTQTADGGVTQSSCDGSCDVTLTSDATPTVTSVSPETVTANGETLTLTGTNLGSEELDVSVSLGDTTCEVTSLSDNGATQTIECDVGMPLGGAQRLHVTVDGAGYAERSVEFVDVTRSITSVSPSTFGTAGGATLTISGVGFQGDDYSVTVGGVACTSTTFVSNAEIVCMAPALSAGTHSVVVTSGGVAVSYHSVTVNDASAPTISSVSPTQAVQGEDIVVTGTNLFQTTVVDIDGAQCSVHSYSGDGTTVTCTLAAHAAGTYPLDVTVIDYGTATGSVDFTYLLAIDSLSETSGSFGGGQNLTITGRGFNTNGMSVTICDNDCVVYESLTTATEVTCVTPSNSGSGSVVCDIIVSDDDSSTDVTSSNAYTYSGSTVVTSVDPIRGGTGGGTTVTIGGSGFGTDSSAVEVFIAGSECVISSVDDNEIVCVTEPHDGAVETQVEVRMGTSGIAVQQSAAYEYIDLWSSVYTWGGVSLPEEGDFVVIPSHMTVLLDTQTPILKLLLIDGGKVIFENEESSDLLLQSEIIFIANGGVLQAGTEDEPFIGMATIMLHGHVRSKELPIYGTKVLAVRQGTLDLHGKPTSRPWTRLDGSVSAGTNTLDLEQAVDWEAGDEVVIATTGERHSQRETEQHTIASVSNGGRTLTLVDNLAYGHLGEDIEFHGEVTLEARAEVGLLSRNLRFTGSDDAQWHDLIEACPNGFDTGEFATQTCFQGRFGEEIGNDEFGAQILMHAPTQDQHDLTARISNMELNYVGQAYRLGRYAIHFHLLGDMEGSYVRSCAIHKSFNRAVNIHGTHNVMIEHNVAYNIMGGAFFLEDGIEIGNTFQYNLAIFVKSSTSLQNDDITPAAYWVTNANNTYQHNVAAGGTHFGFWYRMHAHPDGPSFDANYCPRKIPMGHFENNTVHSQGWFGIWIFQVFTPVETGCCSCTTPAPARFYSLTAYHCEKGAEWVGGGAIQWLEFLLVNNEKAGIEAKMILQPAWPYDEDYGAVIGDGTIVAYDPSGVLPNIGTASGIIAPYDRGLVVRNMHFMNFVGNNVCYGVTQIDGTTQDNNGGFTYHLYGHAFTNTDNIIGFRWQHEAVFKSLDDTLTGVTGQSVIPCTGILPSDCIADNTGKFTAGEDGCVCPADQDFHRFSFNNYSPSSLEGKDAAFTNAFGVSITPFKKKRRTHPFGWMIILPSGNELGDAFQMQFVDAEQLVNISYSGVLYDLERDNWIIMEYEFYQRPDAINVIPGVNPELGNSSDPVTYGANVHGDWFIEEFEPRALTNNTASVMTLLSGNGRDEENDTVAFYDRSLTLNVYRCYFSGCIPPPDPETLPPSEGRPNDALFWSDPATWALDEETGEVVGALDHDADVYRRRRDVGLPEENQDIVIATGTWVVLDVENLPQFKRVWIYGTLEFEWSGELDLFLSATHIFISGGRLIVGWEENPISGNATIELRGDWFTDDININSAPNIGSKVIAAFGGLDMHGKNVSHAWTELESSVFAGDTSLTLVDSTDWQVGNEIVIATTSYAPTHSEQRTISAVSDDGRTLSFDEPLLYDHTATVEDIGNGEQVRMAAEVGLLTRNVRIYGKDYRNGMMAEQGFGGRVFVSRYAVSDGYRTGYARMKNVEFKQMGQEGWSDFFDPRYALAYLDTGDVTDTKPSYVKECTFHDNYNTAFGSFGANGMVFEDNVVYRTVGSSVRFWDQNHVIRDNLILEMIYSGTWNDREEFRFTWYAALEVTSSIGITMTGNHVAGSERGGFRVDGEVCGETSLWSDNVAHGALEGVVQLPDNPDGLTPCTYLNGFFTWRNLDFGIYTQVSGSIEINNHISIDDLVGLYPMVTGPASVGHSYADKYVSVTNSHYVGYSTQSQCTDPDIVFADSDFFTLLSFSGLGRSWVPGSRTRSGITWGTFSSSGNAAPTKPFINIKSYQAIRGKTTVSNTVMKNYDDRCVSVNGFKAYAFHAPPNNDDAIHPLYTSSMTLEDVDEAYLAFIPTPSVGKINPADCVDMDCDGLKKAFLTDKDGSLLGEPGTIFAFSEFAWGGDRRRGTGDFRLPLTMLTQPDGTRVYIDDMATEVGRGIAREQDQCTFRNSYNAWMCSGADSPSYHMLMLESMDSDTETRRCSPIGVMNTDTDERYIDLVNGPQDHGWCMGYTCQKRLSTFPVVFAANKAYELHFKGTTPQHLRFHWLNPEESDASDAITLGIYYFNPYRLDVYVDGEYKMPVNGYMENDQLRFSSGDYTLDPTDVDVGDNWFDREYATQWITLKGSSLVEIQTTSLVFVNFDMPFLTVDEFFGPNIVSNMASFFDIPESRIRVATAVREDGNRKKRTSVIEVTIEITNPPHDLDVSDPDDLSTEELQSIASSIIDTYQLGELDDVLEVTILSLSVTEPVPATDSEEWQYLVQLETSTEVTVSVPASLSLESEPVPQHEGAPFRVQPALRAYDADDEAVTTLGSLTEPWELTAYLFHISTLYSEAELVGTEVVTSQDGWFNFSSLGVSHAGNYEIQFMVTSPEGASHLRVTSAEFNVDDREIAAMVTSAPNSTYEGTVFDVTVGLADAFTRELLEDIAWRGHTWEVTLALYSAIQHPGAMTVPAATATVNPSTGTATFTDISIARRGRYYLQFRFRSTPTEYDIAVPSDMFIDVYPAGYTSPATERFDRVTIRFEGSYAEVAYELEDYFAATVYNEMFDRFNDRTSFDNFEVYEGSIMVEFDVSGTEEDLEAVVAAIYDLVQAGLTVTFNGETVTTTSDYLVNGEDYGDDESEEDEEEDELPSWAVVLIIIACVMLFLAAVAYIVYRVYSKKRLHGQMRHMQERHEKKRRDRETRRQTLAVSDAEDARDGYFSTFKESSSMGSSSVSLQSGRNYNDEDLIIPAAAPPAATLYNAPPKSDKFDFVNVRPRTGYEQPGKLPALGSAKPRTPETSTLSASALNVNDGLLAPGTPDVRTNRGGAKQW